MKHTPGPWKVVAADWGSTDGDPIQYVRYYVEHEPPEISVANGLLIAAAPDLLHEAKHALEVLDDLELSDNPATDPANPQAAGFHMVRAGLARAIAKAEGK